MANENSKMNPALCGSEKNDSQNAITKMNPNSDERNPMPSKK